MRATCMRDTARAVCRDREVAAISHSPRHDFIYEYLQCNERLWKQCILRYSTLLTRGDQQQVVPVCAWRPDQRTKMFTLSGAANVLRR